MRRRLPADSMAFLKTLCTLGWLALALAPSLSAQSDPVADIKDPGKKAEFQSLDSSQDGQLTVDEFTADKTGTDAAKAEQTFEKKDRDHDGALSPEEFARRQRWGWWLAAFSLITFLGTLLVIPIIVERLPEDYFIHEHRRADWLPTPRIRIEWLIAKNVLGFLVLLAGIAMLILPGQGLLTMLFGIAIMDFPGKRWFLQKILARPGVLKAINWMRRRRGKPPMLPPPLAQST